MGVLSSCVCVGDEREGARQKEREKAERKRGIESGGERAGERERGENVER